MNQGDLHSDLKSEINKVNTSVLDQLIANLGKSYRDAYGGEKAAPAP